MGGFWLPRERPDRLDRPTHPAFLVRKYKKNGEHRAEYTQIGAVWPHQDGDGFDIVLTAFPVNGRVTLRKVKPKHENAG
jgi:hypothetical protein